MANEAATHEPGEVPKGKNVPLPQPPIPTKPEPTVNPSKGV